MANFPNLSVNPSVEGWSEEKAFDPTIRARSEAGYVKTRPRCTRIPKKYSLSYDPLPLADKLILEAFENSVKCGADAFNWKNPMDDTTKPARFAEPVKYSVRGNRNFWKVDLVIEEV